MMQLEGFSITEACRATGLSRAGFYRDYQEHEPLQADVELRDAIQKIAIENRFYGYRRVTAQLHHQGLAVNHKRVLRLMRIDNLLAVRKRRYVLTTDSHHPFAIYPNLVPRLVVNGINQLWVADITYIRLKAEFVYLAVILDGFSRKVVGWALDRTLAMRLTMGALGQAIGSRQPEPGLVHHSDRGLQYASAEYVEVLENNRVIPSMSRPANPYDNASCESFMKTLKREEIYANKYDDLEHLRANIGEFIEQYYNRLRLHSALGYQSPEEFEQRSESLKLDSRSATMKFFGYKVENQDEHRQRNSTATLGKGATSPPSPDPLAC